MGFNIEQYEMYDNGGYSNISGNDALRGVGTICVKGNPVYGIPLTYAGFQATKKGRAKISENRQICQARYATKKGSSEAPLTTSDMPVEKASTPYISIAPSNIAPLSSSTAPKSNTGLYIGIGVGVLAIGIVTILLIRKK